MKKLEKIAVFLYSMAGGGAERVVSVLLGEFAKRYEVHLILMNERIFYEIPKNVAVHFIEKSAPFENGVKKLLKLPFLGLKYKKLCQKIGVDLHFVFMNRPCYAAIFGRIFGDKTPLIINECSTPSVLYAAPTLKNGVSKFLLKWLYPKADFIYANSLGNMADLCDNFAISPKKMAVLYNATDLEKIAQKSCENIAPEFENRPFFLSIGRLDSGKNHALLIKAYAGLKNCDKDLIILGDGVLRPELENLVKNLGLEDRVKLPGFDPNPYKYLARCYAFVFVSRFEGFSNALIEALACEKCVICSDHKSGARELLGENEFGILVGVDDLGATKMAMERILNEPEIVKYYEKKAKIRAKNFDKNEIIKKLCVELEGFYEKFRPKF